MKTPSNAAHPLLRTSARGLFVLFAAAAFVGCSSVDLPAPIQGSPGGRVPDIRESQGGRDDAEGAAEEDAEAEGEEDVRVFLDAGGGSDDVTDPIDDGTEPIRDAGGGAPDSSGGTPVDPDSYRETTVVVPASGFTTLSGTHFESDYGLSKPDLTCSRIVGPVVFADVYRLTTTSTTPVQAQVFLRTALNTTVLTLPDAMLLQYAPDVRPGDASVLCVANGASTASSTSSLSSVTVSAGASALIVVAGQSAGVEGSYNLLVGRAGEAEPPLTGGGGGGGGGGGTDYACIDGTSIPSTQVCDGFEDCLFGDDEADCGGGGGGTDYTCVDGTPIPVTWVCDGFEDCLLGDDEADCGGGGGGGCSDTCLFALDGFCDEGGGFAFCAPGTDCSDCTGGGGGGCSNTCSFPFDFECDDGGPGSITSLCTFGTDCGDCGPR